ncbi:MAG TPA: response regulator [Patescibacteria group bacterium]|nr:response regulator [Patescibacteria group bacterium]
MYTLLVVDDEQLERQAIRMIVEKRCPEVTVSGEAAEGEAALDLARKCQPDMILMDIRMPVMDGLEAMKRIRTFSPHTRVIFLTAFDEFNYAKEAITLGAAEYLLKPVRPEELVRVLGKVSEEIGCERRRQDEEERLRQQLKHALPFIQMSFVYDLVSGNIESSQEIQERAGFLNLPLQSAAVLLVDIDNFTGLTLHDTELNKQLLKQRVYETVCRVAGEGALVTPLGGDNLVVLLNFAEGVTEATAQKTVLERAEAIRAAVQEEQPVTVTIGAGRYYRDLTDVSKSYYEALKAKQHSFFIGGNQVIAVEDLPHLNAGLFAYPFQREKTVLEKVRCGERQAAKLALEKLLDEICDGHPEFEIIKTSLLELLIVLSRAAIEGGASLEQLTLLNNHLLSEMMACRTVEEVRQYALDCVDRFIDNMLENRLSVNMRVINKACEYIVQNCHRNLSLDEVAQSVHLSSYYFSRLFKQHKGCNFVEFITRSRLALAQKMLRESDYSVVFIAMKVGYQDTSYFCRVFRNELGMTPNQYRNSVRKSASDSEDNKVPLTSK